MAPVSRVPLNNNNNDNPTHDPSYYKRTTWGIQGGRRLPYERPPLKQLFQW
jgi:hypothetical protein